MICRRTTPRTDERPGRPDERHLACGANRATLTFMAIVLTFLLGIGNFAMHKAVLESRHPMLAQMPWMGLMGGRFSFALEFMLLVGALLLTAHSSSGWGWAYPAYRALNGLAAWLILSRRIQRWRGNGPSPWALCGYGPPAPDLDGDQRIKRQQ